MHRNFFSSKRQDNRRQNPSASFGEASENKPEPVGQKLLAISLAVRKRSSLLFEQVDPWYHDVNTIRHVKDFLSHVNAKGYVPAAKMELPIDFNNAVRATPNAFGADVVAELFCFDAPNLDSFFCTTCSVWESSGGMFHHLQSEVHKETYILHHHQDVFKIADQYPQRQKMEAINRHLQHLKTRGTGDNVNLRMVTLIDQKTIRRLSPLWFQRLSETSGKSAGANDVEVITISDSDEEDKTVELERKRKRAKASGTRKSPTYITVGDSDDEQDIWTANKTRNLGPQHLLQESEMKKEPLSDDAITLSDDDEEMESEREPERNRRSDNVSRELMRTKFNYSSQNYQLSTEFDGRGEPRGVTLGPEPIEVFQLLVDSVKSEEAKILRLKIVDVIIKVYPTLHKDGSVPLEVIHDVYPIYDVDPEEGDREFKRMSDENTKILAQRRSIRLAPVSGNAATPSGTKRRFFQNRTIFRRLPQQQKQEPQEPQEQY